MTWQGIGDGIDAVEAWIVAQSFWVQVPLLLAVLLPTLWLVAGLIDRVVDRVLAPHARREIRLAARESGSSGEGQR